MNIIGLTISVFGVILIGFLARSIFTFNNNIRILFDKYTFVLEKISYYILLPSLIIVSIVNVEINIISFMNIFSTIWVVNIFIIVAVILLGRLYALSGPDFSSVFQGATRWTGYVALGAAASFQDPHVSYFAALSLIAHVPLINILSIFVLERARGGQNAIFWPIVKSVIKNPIVISIIVGAFLSLNSLYGFYYIESVLSFFALLALPVGLFIVGASCRWHAIAAAASKHRTAILYSTFIKLIIYPAIVWVVGITFDLPWEALVALTVVAAAPAAPSSYVLARELGGNSELMATIISIGTLFSCFTMTFWVFVLLEFTPSNI